MMNEIVNNVFLTIKPVTRTYIFGVITLFVLIRLNVIHISSLYFDVDKILEGQFWRLFTSFFLISDSFNLSFIFHLLFTFVDYHFYANHY